MKGNEDKRSNIFSGVIDDIRGQWSQTVLFPGKFRLGIRKRFFIWRWVMLLEPERQQDVHPWGFSVLD